MRTATLAPALALAVLLLALAHLSTAAVPFTSAEYFAQNGIDPDTFWKIIEPTPDTYVDVDSLPANFSWASYGPDNRYNVLPMDNQHTPKYCGSCWAHGPMFSLGTRLWIQNKFQGEPIKPSNQWMVDQNVCGNCDGGNPGCVLQVASQQGIPLDTCHPYVAENNAFDLNCFTCDPTKGCSELAQYNRVYAKEFGPVQGANAMKAEIFARGPISCGMAVTNSFVEYKSGIISGPLIPPPVDHIISVVGWGQSGNKMYWVLRNSWGVNWGMQGFAFVDIHHDFRISSDCLWAVPELLPNGSGDV